MKKIKIQLIPSTCYGKNLRSILKPSDWRAISRDIRICANGICEICGKEVGFSGLECHEKWKFIVKKKNGKKIRIQKLIDLQASCKICHLTCHIGYAYHAGRYEDCVDNYLELNQCTYRDFKKAEKKAWKKYQKRSKYKWCIDTSELESIVKNKSSL